MENNQNWGGERKGAGRKPAQTFAERHAADPDGSLTIRLPNRVLLYLEELAAAQGLSVPEYLSRQEINRRIL